MAAMLLHLLTAVALASNPPVSALDAVVLIHQGDTVCAGVLIDDAGTVVTAYHCVAPGGRPRVRMRTGEQGIARIVGVDVGRDLAVLKVPDLAGQPWLEWVSTAPEVGAAIWALGHPYGASAPEGFFAGGLRWSITEGMISAVGPVALQISAGVNPGNSGGPVVNAEGELVGIVSRRLASSEGLAFAGRIETIADLASPDSARGLGPVGGTLAVAPVVSVWNAPGGVPSTGVQVNLAFRDRVVLCGVGRWALSPRWGALQYGDITWLGSEVRLALRQRIGRGRFAPRADAWVSAAVVESARSEFLDGDVDLIRDSAWTPLVGGRLSVATGALELGYDPQGSGAVASVLFNWPGVIKTF